jgi:hypothetical protein
MQKESRKEENINQYGKYIFPKLLFWDFAYFIWCLCLGKLAKSV